MAQQFETIALIGIGLIGSSMAREIKDKGLAGTSRGLDAQRRDAEAGRAARIWAISLHDMRRPMR